MKGGFSRVTFDPAKHFIRVLMQQGRVQVDADWNEQAAILLHYLQGLARDLIGPHGGPNGNPGFKISDVSSGPLDFKISEGHYYVDGILCENGEGTSYTDQPDFKPDPYDPEEPVLVYLDVWERLITYVQDNDIREVALGGADTASRSKLVWQVKTEILNNSSSNCQDMEPTWDELIKGGVDGRVAWQAENRGLLAAKAKRPEDINYEDPCISSPGARYRGHENQLYRVEIHTGGGAGTANIQVVARQWLGYFSHTFPEGQNSDLGALRAR